MVKHLPAMQETRVQSLGQEDPLEEGMATRSSVLLGESHGQRSLGGCSPWGHKERDTTDALPSLSSVDAFLLHTWPCAHSLVSCYPQAALCDVYDARALVWINLFVVGCSRWFPFLDVLNHASVARLRSTVLPPCLEMKRVTFES